MRIPRFLLTVTAAGLLPLLAHASDLTALIGDGDRRAALAAASLLEMGYLDVKSIAGGFDAWVAAGKTVVKPSVPSFE